jgi:hypothetical protein
VQVPPEWKIRAEALRFKDIEAGTQEAWHEAPDERYTKNYHLSEVAHLKQRLVRRSVHCERYIIIMPRKESSIPVLLQ